MSVVEGYDQDIPAELRSVVDQSGQQLRGYSTFFSGNGEYQWRQRGLQFGATGSTSFQYRDETELFEPLAHNAGLGLSKSVGRTVLLTAKQSAMVTPSYLYGLFPVSAEGTLGEVPTAAPDHAVRGSESRQYGTTLELLYALGSRRSVLVTGARQLDELKRVGEPTKNHHMNRIRAEVIQKIGRNASVSGRYGYGVGDFLSGDIFAQLAPLADLQTSEHSAMIGMTYSRQLSATRRASVAVRIGSSAVVVPEALRGLTDTARQLRAAGDGSAEYQFKRTWRARGSYRRGVEYVAAVAEPVFTDGVSIGLDGSLARHISFSASAGYLSGQSVFRRDAIALETYTGSARVTYHATPVLSTHAEYLYYYYDFGSRDLGLPAGLERNAVRVGMSMRLPGIRR